MGATACDFTSSTINSSASNIREINRVSESAQLGKNIINFAHNHGGETDSDWISKRWTNDCTYTFSYATDQKYLGQRSIKFNSTNVTGDGRARAYQDFSTSILEPGNKYTLSAYVKTSNIQMANTDYATGACIAIYCSAAANSFDTYSEYLTGTTDTDIDNGWRRISVTVEIPQDANYTRVNLAIRNATGIAYFDGIQVEKASIANTYNMLENCSFEDFDNGFPTGWIEKNLTVSPSSDYISSATKKYGDYSFKIDGEASVKKEIVQWIPVSGSENDTYIISGWAKANAVPPTNSNRKFKISIKVGYSDGTSVWKDPAVFNCFRLAVYVQSI